MTEFGTDGRVVDCCDAVQGGPTLFAAYDDVHGAEIWRTDGTWAGTELVADVSSTITNYYSSVWPDFEARFDGDVFFTQDDGVHGTSLPWLTRLAVPTLVMSGDDDPIIPTVNGRIIARLIPGARLHIVLGGGHLFLLEEAASSAAVIEEFLR